MVTSIHIDELSEVQEKDFPLAYFISISLSRNSSYVKYSYLAVQTFCKMAVFIMLLLVKECGSTLKRLVLFIQKKVTTCYQALSNTTS
jgi:hypothetical protein